MVAVDTPLTAAGLGPSEAAPAPQLTAPSTGLLITAQVIDHDTDGHWANGIIYSPENCADIHVIGPCVTGVAGVNASASNRPARIEFLPFAADAYDSCSSFGFQAADYTGRAQRTLRARESKAVERELWLGLAVPANMHLNQSAPTNGPAVYPVGGGSAQSCALGLALLCQAAADLNLGSGMIHCRPFLAERWFGLDLLQRDSRGQLWTGTGIPVVAGHGYPGTAPGDNGTGNVTANSEWAYITDPVIVHRGPVTTATPEEAMRFNLDRDSNRVIVRAQRFFAPLFGGCGIAAAQIDPTVSGL